MGVTGQEPHGQAIFQSRSSFPMWTQEFSAFQHPLRGQLNYLFSPVAVLKTGQQSSDKLQRLSLRFQMTWLQELLNLSLYPSNLPRL